MYGKFSLLSFGANLKPLMCGFELCSIRHSGRMPFSVLSFGFNPKYMSVNLSVLGMYIEREVLVTGPFGDEYEMRWTISYIGFRKTTLDEIRENGWFRKLVNKLKGEKHNA